MLRLHFLVLPSLRWLENEVGPETSILTKPSLLILDELVVVHVPNSIFHASHYILSLSAFLVAFEIQPTKFLRRTDHHHQ
jgi:hypothetical protein